MTLNQALISETTLSASAASVTISVPSGYTDLRLVMSLRDDRSGYAINSGFITLNSGGTYTGKMLYGSSTTVGSNTSYQFSINSPVSDSNTFSNTEIYIPNYSVSGVAKSYSMDTAAEGTSYNEIDMNAVLWSGTGAITSIVVTPAASANFVAGSSFTLYGISKLGVTPTQLPKASGGDIIKNDGTYWYHAFLSTGSFVPQTTLSADVLVVAGGGGAGDQPGGGAGGVIYQANKSVSSSTSIIVGAGGAGSTTTPSKGSDSFFGAMKAFGGGAGYTNPLNVGGSGGGTYNTLSDYGTSNQTSNDGGTGYGNRGGSGAVTVNYRGGGGGGAGTAGKDNNDPSGGAFSTGGAGGDGLNTWSSWLSATSLGVSGYIAGGGGSGAVDNLGNNGGLGGGGNGGQSGTSMSSYPKKYATSAVINTGSGGGGGGWSGDGYALGGNGGSGLVIIRYPMA